MTKKELEAKTVVELRAIAKKANIALKAKKKADIVAELYKALRSAGKKTSEKEKPKKAAEKKPTPKAKRAEKKKTTAKKPEAKKPRRVAKKTEEIKKPARRTARKPSTEKPLVPTRARAVMEMPKKAVPTVILPPPEAPAEYGEDMVSAIVLEPAKIFVFWEIKESTLKQLGGRPTIRVYDVTGGKIPEEAGAVFDIDAFKRIGSKYIDVSPERQYIVDIGLIAPKKGFQRVARSERIATFRTGPAPSEEGQFVPEEHYDFISEAGGSEPPPD